MKARIIEIERQELAPGIFWRVMWSSVPYDQLTNEDTQEFWKRTDELLPRREVISSFVMRKIQQDKKKRPNHFFESISISKNRNRIEFSKN